MSKNAIEIYKVGSKVKLTEDVIGTIIGIHIGTDNHVSYECGWWNSRSYNTQAFGHSEVEVVNGEKIRIGFA